MFESPALHQTLMSLNRAVLVLNNCYLAVNVIPARRALTLICKGAAVVEVPSSAVVRTSQITLPLPSVIRLLHYSRLPKQTRSVSRRGILQRDRGRCQYCDNPVGPSSFTLDHVKPRARGGQSTWDNLVTACKPCNNRKSDRTPEEAGMRLARKPHRITLQTRHRLLLGADDAAWEPYLVC